MEHFNSNTDNKPSTSLMGQLGPFHNPDNWLMPAVAKNHDAQFAAAVVDVALGARAIASILSGHLTDLGAIASGADGSARTLLSESDTGALARLAVFSLNHLYELAEARVDHFNKQAAEGAQA